MLLLPPPKSYEMGFAISIYWDQKTPFKHKHLESILWDRSCPIQYIHKKIIPSLLSCGRYDTTVSASAIAHNSHELCGALAPLGIRIDVTYIGKQVYSGYKGKDYRCVQPDYFYDEYGFLTETPSGRIPKEYGSRPSLRRRSRYSSDVKPSAPEYGITSTLTVHGSTTGRRTIRSIVPSIPLLKSPEDREATG